MYLQYSRSIALFTVCLVLLSNYAHGTDAGLEHSNSQICFHTCSTLFSSSVKSPSLSAVHSPHSAIHHKMTCGDMTVPLMLSAGLICRLSHLSNFLHHSSQGWISLFSYLLSLSRPRRFWQTSSLYVTGFAGRHTTRRCCPLLQYDLNKLTCG